MDNDKDASPLILVVTASPDLLSTIAASPNSLTFGFVIFSPVSITNPSVSVCLSHFSFPIWLFFFSFLAYHTILTSSSPIQIFKSILLLLEDDYAVQYSVSSLEIFKK